MLVVLYALSLPALVLMPVVAAALMTAGLAILVFEFFLYHETIDLFYPKKTGRNVVGVIEPVGPVKRQVIVSGHHDSARIFNFHVDRPELYARRVYGGIGAFIAMWAASSLVGIASLFAPIPLTAVIALALFLGACLIAVLPLWRFASRSGTPGAGDNLAASACALEIGRVFREERDQGKGLAGTRIVVASFDAEEAGLRGARDWAKRRMAEFAEMPTWCFNMDCLYNKDDAFFLTTDINGSVKLDAEAAMECVALAAETGAACEARPIAFLTGGSDAAELARRGARAVTMLAMPWSNANRSAAYHTPADLPEAIRPGTLEAAIRIGVGFARKRDVRE